MTGWTDGIISFTADQAPLIGLVILKERERIIKLLEEGSEFESADYAFNQIISSREFKLPDGNDVIEVNDVWEAFAKQRERLIELIQGEKENTND